MTNNSVFTTNAIGCRAQTLFNHATSDSAVMDTYGLLAQYNPNTARHSSGVAMLAAAFAIKLGLDDDHAVATVRAALLHDIGKIEISNDLLNKPSIFTATERLKMQSHPIDGYARARKLIGNKQALPVLLHHRLQADRYPNDEVVYKTMNECGLAIEDIDEKTLQSLVCVVVADNYESRTPIGISTHSYVDRDYSIADEKQAIRSDFIETGHLRKLGLLATFNLIVDLGESVSQQSVIGRS